MWDLDTILRQNAERYLAENEPPPTDPVDDAFAQLSIADLETALRNCVSDNEHLALDAAKDRAVLVARLSNAVWTYLEGAIK